MSNNSDSAPPDEPRGDMFAAVQSLAADNARKCDIIMAADKIVEYLDSIQIVKFAGHRRLEVLLDAFKVVRQGQ